MENNVPPENTGSRREFLERTTLAGIALMMSNLRSFAGENDNKKIRVAVIGCGSVSGRYLPSLSKSPNVEVVSVCDIIRERAVSRAKEFNVKNVYGNIDEMLAGVPFDLMVTLTDMQEHGRLNKMALMKGHHVWSEKPMANTYAEGKALLDLAKSKNLRIWGAPAVVNSPQFAFMARQIREGKLGRIAAAHGHYGHTGPTWSSFFYENGGGSLPDLGVYNIATLTGLLGPARSVMAMTSIVNPVRDIDFKGKVKVVAEDNAMIIMEHEKGILSHIQCGFNYFDPHGHEAHGQTKASVQIWGDEGNMSLIGYDWEPLGVELDRVGSDKGEVFEKDARGFEWQEGATVISEALAKGTEPLIAVEHALHVLEIIEAARKSSLEGRRIVLKSKFKYPVV
jgi:predicted dehydrogenase